MLIQLLAAALNKDVFISFFIQRQLQKCQPSLAEKGFCTTLIHRLCNEC